MNEEDASETDPATRGEDGDDFLREWALWAVRNLCAGSDAARAEIEGLQPQTAADSQHLTAMGLNVQLDPDTGKVRVKTGGPGSGPGPSAGGGGVARGDGGVACAQPVTRLVGDGGGGGGGGARGGRGMMMPGDLLMTPTGAQSRAGKAVAAALAAGFEVDPDAAAAGDSDEEVEIPAHWKIADLS